jgi:UDPglucose 6-dehydrogenase
MKILYIGGGFVGACSAAVSADSGHEVVVYDKDKEKIKKFSTLDKDEIESVLFEKGLGELMIRNRSRLRFTDDIGIISGFMDEAEAVFMCLPTPEKDSTGETDLSYYEDASRELAGILLARNGRRQEKYVIIINKSTVPIDMIGRTKEIMESSGVKNYGVGSNPEFLVEGKAIEGSIKPERIVVGGETEKDFELFRRIYKRFLNSPTAKIIEVNPYEAAAGKLLANYMLFNRLANCYDVVGRVCENFQGLRFENLRKTLITDKRIGEWGFFDSMYAGGSCFIKDARSLVHQLKEKNVEVDLIEDTLKANDRQLNIFLTRPEKELAFDFAGKTIGLLGLAFKRDTNDIRNSSALGTTEFLLKKEVNKINAFDPVAGENFMKYFNGREGSEKIELFSEEEKAMVGADAIIICADWPEFRELTDKILKNFPKGNIIMDGRRMLEHSYPQLSEAGYDIIAVGSPLIKKSDKLNNYHA